MDGEFDHTKKSLPLLVRWEAFWVGKLFIFKLNKFIMSHIKQIDFILDLLDNGDYSLDQAKQEVAKTFNGESTPTWDSVDEKGNDLPKAPKAFYKVQRLYGSNWDDAFFNGEVSVLFDTREEAEADIKEHHASIKDAIKEGFMDKDSLDEDLRIVKVDGEDIKDAVEDAVWGDDKPTIPYAYHFTYLEESPKKEDMKDYLEKLFASPYNYHLDDDIKDIRWSVLPSTQVLDIMMHNHKVMWDNFNPKDLWGWYGKVGDIVENSTLQTDMSELDIPNILLSDLYDEVDTLFGCDILYPETTTELTELMAQIKKFLKK
jgi:hypothetical protein